MSERSQLINKLTADRALRESYIRSKVSTNVASQVRALRRRQQLTQDALANASDMKQSRISAMERPGTRWNIETLLRLAASFGVGLIVKFSSFSDMLGWENTFGQDTFDVARIEDDQAFRRDPRPTMSLSSQSVIGEGSASAANPTEYGEQVGPRSLLLAQIGAADPRLHSAAACELGA